MIKKLKRKVWLISTLILGVYITALIANPSIWTVLLPVIIPTTTLTIGIPTYTVIKHNKQLVKETSNNETIINTNNETNKNINTEKTIKPMHIDITDNYQTNIEKNKIKQKRLKY